MRDQINVSGWPTFQGKQKLLIGTVKSVNYSAMKLMLPMGKIDFTDFINVFHEIYVIDGMYALIK